MYYIVGLMILLLIVDYVQLLNKFKKQLSLRNTALHEAAHAVIDEHYERNSVKKIKVNRHFSLIDYFSLKVEYTIDMMNAAKTGKSILGIEESITEGYTITENETGLSLIKTLVSIRCGEMAEELFGDETVDISDKSQDKMDFRDLIEDTFKKHKIQYEELEKCEQYIALLELVDKNTKRILNNNKELIETLASLLTTTRGGVIKSAEIQRVIREIGIK